MTRGTVNVLAVGDPAIHVYVDEKNDFLSEFEKQTGIYVNFTIVKWSEYYTTLLESFETYKYDIVMIAGHLWLKEFIEKEYLLQLKCKFKEDYDYDDILPAIRKELELNNVKYLLPSFCDGHILLYRKSKINKSLSNVVSLENVMDLIRNSKDSVDNIFVLKAHPSEIFLDFLPYLRNEGVDAFNDKGMPTFYNKNGVRALKKYISMKNYCSYNVEEFGNEEVLKIIQEDRCNLGVSWGGQLGQIMNEKCINREDIGFAALETSWNVTWSFGINKLCREQESAEQFLQYITSKNVDRKVGAYSGNPTRTSSFKIDGTVYKWYPALRKMIETAKQLPHLTNTGELIGIVTEEIVKAFVGKQSAETALYKASKKIESIR
ncbi:hypothetical protein SH2C18_16100 [Clostridium sediminicola]|uniref:extracellular solute-binding protein n=1 Tax=Clostridium sediminicola TaxID=3114879 RepID=UPI0031F22ADC